MLAPDDADQIAVGTLEHLSEQRELNFCTTEVSSMALSNFLANLLIILY